MMTFRELGLLLLVLLLPSLASAATSVSAVGTTVVVDREFRLPIRLTDTADLYGAGLDLVYDPSRLEIVDADGDLSNGVQPLVSEGTFLSSGGTTSVFHAEALQDSRPGRLVLGLVRRGRVNGVSSAGERTLVSVGFRALTSGTSAVHLENVSLFDSRSENPMSVATSQADFAAVIATPNHAPVIALPSNVTARPGLLVLDASESFDPDGDSLSYSWRQTSGAAVPISSASNAALSFVLAGAAAVAFELAVSDGSVTVRQTVVVTADSAADTPPAAVIASPARGRGVLSISYALSDAQGDPADLTAEFSVDGGGSYRPATLAPGGEGVMGLATAFYGSPHTFLWNSAVDLGQVLQPGVRLRLTPRATVGGAVGQAASSAPFVVDDTFLGVAVRLLAPLPGTTLVAGVPVVLRGEAYDALGNRIDPSRLTFASSLDGPLGANSPLIATFSAVGEHVLQLTATDSRGATGTVTELLRVDPALPLPLVMTFTGRIVSDEGAPAADGSQLVLFNAGRGVSGSGRVSGGDGSYQAVLGSLTSPVAAAGDAVTFDFVDSSGVPRTLTPAGVTLTPGDINNRLRLQDLTFASNTSVVFSRGLNMISLPADPGTTARGAYSSADLLQDSGGLWMARVVAGKYEICLPGGTPRVWNLHGNEGYLLSLPQDLTFTYRSRAWPQADRFWNLTAGLAIVAFPFGIPSGFSTGDVLTLTGGNLLVEFTFDDSIRAYRAHPFLRALERAPTLVHPGRGYLVRPSRTASVAIPTATGQ